MKNFKNIVAQGDVLIWRVETIPQTASIEIADKELIVTHSETGHNHVMVLERNNDIANVEMYNAPDNPLLSWLKVNRPVSLDHKRSFDTHESIMFDTGIYEVRRQREYTPQGWRKALD